ncbi:hypothetical protein E2C01_073407 [Portunus trituberculatus]|uniref:Uncharacterized protein n=1 Tax=Portunus trituberculatus TaxID=210409 RepID=A0A5B7I5A0_PORTR|nr:hypothetical protein [Portunus trituberculatus]
MPHFHSHHNAVRSLLFALAITTLDLPTLLVASGVHHSQQHMSFTLLVPSFLEENQPATTPVIPTKDYPRSHKDPIVKATKIYGSL